MTDKELAIYIGTKIKEYRLQRGLTQKELAVLVDMGDTTIANYEKGFRTPKKNTLFKISSALSVTIDDLFPPIHKADTPTASPDLLTQQITDKVVQLTPDNKKKRRDVHRAKRRRNEDKRSIGSYQLVSS